MVLAKIRWQIPSLKLQTIAKKGKLKIDLIKDENIKDLYKRQLSIQIKEWDIIPADNLEVVWKKIEKNVKESAIESLGIKTTHAMNKVNKCLSLPKNSRCQQKKKAGILMV